MNQKDAATLELIVEFSHAIEVTPPKTTDIGHWWHNALEEISDFWLNDLKDFGIFSKSDSPILQKMHVMLIDQIEKRGFLESFV